MKEDKIDNNIKSKTKRNILLIILIIIGIIAIIYSAYVLNLKPYVAELEKRDRDPARIEDLSLIDSALTKLRDTSQNISWGDQNRVYISLPSYSANCSGLDLPTLPDDWEYRCKTEADYQNINGSGWLPVDFTKLPKDSVILNSFQDLLPTDPTNTSDSGYYYAYVSGENNNYVLTSLLESDEHLKKTASKDGGTDPARLEVGSNLSIWAKATGLVGYWNFDEGEGEIAKDLSGNNNNGALINGPTWTDGKIGKALSFDGINNFVLVNSEDLIFNATDSFSFEAWIKTGKRSQQLIIDNRIKSWPLSILRVNNDKIQFVIGTIDKDFTITGNTIIPDNKPHHIIAIRDRDTKKLYLYIDGKQDSAPVIDESSNVGTDQIKIGSHYISEGLGVNGFISGVKIYNRTLTSIEIQAIYNATK